MTPQVGLVVPEQLMGADLVSFAVSIEDAGLQSAWFTEIGREALVRAAFAAAATSRITIGTAVSLWTRSPVTAATAAAELHQLSSGRFAYGLGCGTQWHNENWHGIDYARPSERLDEYVRAVRGVWGAGKNAAGAFSFAGDHIRLQEYRNTAYDGAPPLLLAAVGPAMLRLAGRQADGVIFNPASTPWNCKHRAERHIEAGLAAASRRRQNFARAAVIRCAVNSDLLLARRWIRRDIAQYGQYPSHQRTYEEHGFGVEAEAIVAAMGAGDENAATAAVSDAMVDTFGIARTPGNTTTALDAWTGVIDTAILMPTMAGMSEEEIAANSAAVRDVFAD